MKLIDLFIKITKKGEIPKKIRFNGRTYTLYLDEENNHYYQDDECKYFMLGISCLESLNDEVEIIEDTTKDIEKLDIFSFNKEVLTNEELGVENYLVDVCSKINEIIDNIKGENNE